MGFFTRRKPPLLGVNQLRFISSFFVKQQYEKKNKKLINAQNKAKWKAYKSCIKAARKGESIAIVMIFKKSRYHYDQKARINDLNEIEKSVFDYLLNSEIKIEILHRQQDEYEMVASW